MDRITGIIYMLTCRTTELSYIGQTITTLKKRIAHHLAAKERFRLQNALHKYGIDDFDVEILHDNIPFKDLNALERYCIWIYNTVSPNGYNLDGGGKNRIVSDETRAKLAIYSAQRVGELNPRYRKDIREYQDLIIQMYQDGLPSTIIAKYLNCGDRLIRIILKENGIKIRARKDVKQYTSQIIDEYQSGISVMNLSEKYDCSYNIIRNILKRNNIELGI